MKACSHGVPWSDHCLLCEKAGIEIRLEWMTRIVAANRARLEEIEQSLPYTERKMTCPDDCSPLQRAPHDPSCKEYKPESLTEKSGANEEAERMAGTITGSIVGDFLRRLDAAEQTEAKEERPFWLTCRCGWSSGPCREDCWRVLDWIANGSVL